MLLSTCQSIYISIQAQRKKCLSTQITCLFSNMCKIVKTKQLMNFKICLIKNIYNIQKEKEKTGICLCK